MTDMRTEKEDRPTQAYPQPPVCFWIEAKASESYSYVTVCGRAISFNEDWEYCPHCGKPIAYVRVK